MIKGTIGIKQQIIWCFNIGVIEELLQKVTKISFFFFFLLRFLKLHLCYYCTFSEHSKTQFSVHSEPKYFSSHNNLMMWV